MPVDKRVPLQTSTTVNMDPTANVALGAAKKTIEETYQKKSQLEHILLRPDTYIGSTDKHTQSLWVYENEKMVHRTVTYVPGLYKIFDEILVNAADNKQRDPKMDSLKVVIDVDNNTISVCNNGDGVPVEIHQEERVYVPELIFGHLLTSSNYDDNEKKTTGGRNGYGAKLTNIFSTEFVIETADGKRQKKYKQIFSNNMGNKSEPKITKCKEGENWTKVTFKPDLEKFNMSHLEDDVVALMRKRVFDMAGCLGKTVKVELNGTRVPVKSFTEYVDLYLRSASESREKPLPRIQEKVNERWEVCVTLSEGQFQQVSFVNAIATIKGGTHVDYVANQIANNLMNVVNKKQKNANLKPHNVKNHLWVFVNSLIDNPAFDSQTKETLTIRQSNFGSKCELSETFLKKVTKSEILESLLEWVSFKQSKDLKKTDGTKKQDIRGIPKLEDANEAGRKDSDKCTLILTEGDSAKALAMAGISVVGRNYYGVFPLKGKLLNVRDAGSKQVEGNKEIENLKQILGLKHDVKYTSVKPLRYGHLMIMTDQDHDGSHIKGLVINFIHSFWPSLLKIPSFLVEFITPIVKATHRDGRVLAFYTMPEYESWRESLVENASGWSIKYYKGLGTSTSEEGKEYFSNLKKHKKDFIWMDEQDDQAIELAFSKKKIDARKNWLSQFEPGTYLDQTENLIKYRDFINKELILFSLADLHRSIPSMVDGLKPGQRKILFCAFKRNFVKEAKVAQFSGYVSEHSAYHHGEQSLAGTIIAMAQDYVGTNNINLLQPNGQFGSRLSGGKDAASARYIYTKLSPITRKLFCKDDDKLLDYLNEDGQSIEPQWYVPVIPMVLVNGSEGIGTGWSTSVPNYNPREIIANVRRLLNGEMMEPMHPWYRGFIGSIEKSTKEAGVVGYTVSGSIEEVNETVLRITELPVRRWTQDYKEFLESLLESGEIQGFRQYSDIANVEFLISLSEEKLEEAKREGLLKKFKLTSSISTNNMHLFGSNGVIKKYDTPEQILEEFFHLRLEYYEKRKRIILDNLERELLKLENKVRFILAVVSGEVIVNNRKKADLFLELQQKGFTPFPKKPKTVEAVVAGATDDVEGTEEDLEAGDYDYLLSMAIRSLTLEKVQQLCADRDKFNKEVDDMRKSTPKSLWVKDLDALEAELDEQDKRDVHGDKGKKKSKGNKKNEDITQVFKHASKNPRNNKKTKNPEVAAKTVPSSAMETENIPKVDKPKGRAGSRKAPAKKQEKPTLVSNDEDDDEIRELKDRLAAYNLGSSPDLSAMETEEPQIPASKKQSSKRAAAQKKPVTILSDVSESEDENYTDDEEFEIKEVADPEPGKKGGRKAAATSKAAKPPVAAKKRGAASKQPQVSGQKLLTEMLKPAENSGISPEKKVRKMRESPFNKKSGSILGRVGKGDEATGSEEMLGTVSPSDETEEVIEFVPARARPQRANRVKARYVLSDSESDNASEDSDFSEDEDGDDD
ncbi:DNA_gyraseB domain-containing protein/DNA_topoisoIV domain-containing protein/Toprim domain-containing protein/HATPase_c domain-containing protein [Cephalotus follicularis]|uniref:DNA topoisomerase 2 n=1 Tax=Cephalotus follicularis TaxID=3775 RepID=A0A1Q3D0Y9_CEPFO|nr:DNA_gyraseB domain-containing protein/DNA_topoisoIV domain-containing protein/Toprim domain-containing protein/HATPase_c domain-containing protein [Cephalotus follicularis]